MKLVLDVVSLLAMTADLDAMLTRIATAATTLAEAERASIFLHDHVTDQLWTKVALGTREIRVPASAGIVGHVFKSNTTLLVPEPYNDPRFNREVDRKTGFVTRNLLTVPVKNLERKAIGALQVVNRIGGPFSEVDTKVTELLADQAGVAIQRWYLQAEAMKGVSLRHEMDLARKIQERMIPTHAPELPGLHAIGWAKPASITGGDAYDLWMMSDGRMGIFVGDASGHGIGPTLVVSQVRTLVRALAEMNCDPHWLLTRVNTRLANDLDTGRFITAFLGCMSKDGELTWCSAGHGPMLLRPRAGEKVTILEPTAPPIGVMEDLNADIIQPTPIEPGGALIVTSDGIFEAQNDVRDLYGVERMIDLMNANCDQRPEVLLKLLKEDVRAFQGRDEPVDDQTVVIVERTA